MDRKRSTMNRRALLGKSAVAAGAGVLAGSPLSMAQASTGGSDTIRIGLIGCGGRGNGAVGNCIASSKGVKVTALADVYKPRVDRSAAAFNKKYKAKGNADITPDRCFAGLDAYKKLIACDEVDMVLLCTPPGFRPMHLQAAVEAGKHVFMEKPVAVDPTGVRQVIAASKLAAEKKVAIGAGTCRRRQQNIVDVVKRIHDGQIGEIRGAQIYYLTGPVWVRPQVKEISEFEWQCYNWYAWDWLSGDHIVEQHIHEIDTLHWVMGALPERILGMGGRATRPNTKEQGNIFDHFAIEFEFAGGLRTSSVCRQSPKCAHRVDAVIVGTKGRVSCYTGRIYDEKGEQTYVSSATGLGPAYTLEHTELISSIRAGKPINEGEQVALSTLMAIGGRMAAYTGGQMKYDWLLKASKLDIFPKDPKPGPGIFPPLAVPGKTKLI